MAEILDKIIARKRVEVADAKIGTTARQLEREVFFQRTTISLADRLMAVRSPQIIAEFKRASPSLGIINDRLNPQEVAKGYAFAGAAAMSVLTDVDFFKGDAADLKVARAVLDIPLLRKDFIIDEYQILEAKAWGADIVLLIAACLKPIEIEHLARFARNLGLDVLLEVHSKMELQSTFCDAISMVGVNNRNLKDFSLTLDHSYELAELIPSSIPKISESGISQAETIVQLHRAGYKGFLMGEYFMKKQHPATALSDLLKALKHHAV